MRVKRKKYPKNWHTEIRPAILARAKNCCESCKVENGREILRGNWNGRECYQDDGGNIYDANTSEKFGEDYVGEVHPTNNFIKVVLKVTHLDQDVTNNEPSNLKVFCQRCYKRRNIKNGKNRNSKVFV